MFIGHSNFLSLRVSSLLGALGQRWLCAEVDLKEGQYFPSDGVAWHEVLNIGVTTSVYLMVEPKGGNGK